MNQETQKVTIAVEDVIKIREDCKKAIGAAEALERLHNNADFKTVFLEGYIKDSAVRLVGLLAENALNQENKKGNREETHERLMGIARFSEYMRNVYGVAEQARKALDSLAEAERQFYAGNDESGEDDGYIESSDC